MNSDVDKKTLARERIFGGSSRWTFTVAAIVGCILVIVLWAHSHPFFAVFVAAAGIHQGIVAVINWRNWLTKTETEKAPLRFLDQLEIKEIQIPSKREDFDKAISATQSNLFIAASAMLYTLGCVLCLFRSHFSLGLRLGLLAFGIVAAWILWHCGKRALRGLKNLTCPGCKDLLTSQAGSVLETGCCRKCGRTVLID